MGAETVILVITALAFLGVLYVALRDNSKDRNDDRKLLHNLSKRQELIDQLIKDCEAAHADDKARIDALRADVINDVKELNRVLELTVKDIQFMRAHQHGMDKRIAGLKREVIVTINEASKAEPDKTKKPTVTKSLLKRAGVTQ